MTNFYEQIEEMRIVPVVVLHDANHAVKLADALCSGGLTCAEVTFRTDAAAKSIQLMSEAHPEMLVGAGTILTTDQVDQALLAGAKFIVSPGLNPEVVKYCISKNVPVIPGCCTPTEVEMALSLGLNVVKFFPAEAAGGTKMIKAMSAPYQMVRFMPTGGISATNIKEYLSLQSVIACGGSWMVKDSLIASGDFAQIEALTKEAVLLGKEVSYE